MGGGETYFDKWADWFSQLDRGQQEAYRAQYPAPEGWFECYHLCFVSNEEEFDAVFKRAQQLRRQYIQQQYDLAMQANIEENYEYALAYFANAMMCTHDFPTQDDEERLFHYAIVKRHIANEMALKPRVLKRWHTIVLHYDFSLSCHMTSPRL